LRDDWTAAEQAGWWWQVFYIQQTLLREINLAPFLGRGAATAETHGCARVGVDI